MCGRQERGLAEALDWLVCAMEPAAAMARREGTEEARCVVQHAVEAAGVSQAGEDLGVGLLNSGPRPQGGTGTDGVVTCP
jgi:hypothetical protein